MVKGRLVLSGATVAVIVLAIAGSFLLGTKHALDGLHFTRASASELAQAMQDDHFYSDYRESALIVRGTVSSVSAQRGHEIVELDTGLSTAVLCDLGTVQDSMHAGEVVTVLAEGATAERQTSAVMLRGCGIP